MTTPRDLKLLGGAFIFVGILLFIIMLLITPSSGGLELLGYDFIVLSSVGGIGMGISLIFDKLIIERRSHVTYKYLGGTTMIVGILILIIILLIQILFPSSINFKQKLFIEAGIELGVLILIIGILVMLNGIFPHVFAGKNPPSKEKGE